LRLASPKTYLAFAAPRGSGAAPPPAPPPPPATTTTVVVVVVVVVVFVVSGRSMDRSIYRFGKQHPCSPTHLPPRRVDCCCGPFGRPQEGLEADADEDEAGQRNEQEDEVVPSQRHGWLAGWGAYRRSAVPGWLGWCCIVFGHMDELIGFGSIQTSKQQSNSNKQQQRAIKFRRVRMAHDGAKPISELCV